MQRPELRRPFTDSLKADDAISRIVALHGLDVGSYAPAAITPLALGIALKHYASVPEVNYDSEVLERAIILVRQRWFRRLGVSEVLYDCTDMTIELALSSIDMATSCGTLLSHLDHVTTKGEWLRDPGRKAALYEWLHACMRERRFVDDHPFAQRYALHRACMGVDLKRELRDRARVDAGKTRIFMPSSLPYVALGKLIFGVVQHRIHNAYTHEDFWSRVGVSMEHGGYHKMVRPHAARDLTRAEDGAKFDARQSASVMHGVALALASLVEPDYSSIAFEYMHRERNAVMFVCDGRVYSKNHSNASGSLLTSDFNTFYRAVVETYSQLRMFQDQRIDWQHITNEELDAVFTVSVFGDDSLVSFDRRAVPLINEMTYGYEASARYAAELGCILEPEDGCTVPEKFSSAHSFLGRRCVLHDGKYYPVHKDGVKMLVGLPYFKWKKNDKLACISRLDVVLKEIAFCDDDLYACGEAICDAISRALNLGAFFSNQRDRYARVWMDGVVESGPRDSDLHNVNNGLLVGFATAEQRDRFTKNLLGLKDSRSRMGAVTEAVAEGRTTAVEVPASDVLDALNDAHLLATVFRHNDEYRAALSSPVSAARQFRVWREALVDFRTVGFAELDDGTFPASLGIAIRDREAAVRTYCAFNSEDLGCRLLREGGAWLDMTASQLFDDPSALVQFATALRFLFSFLVRNIDACSGVVWVLS